MTLVAVATAKGAPGGTTCAFLLARVLAEHDADSLTSTATVAAPGSTVLLVECDPAGGDLAPRLALPALPGLPSLALASRHGLTRTALLEHSQRSRVLPGVHLLPGVAGPEQGMALAWIFSELADELSARDVVAVADVGRIRSSAEPVTPFLERAASALLVVADSVPSLLHARAAVEMARGRDVELRLVVAGRREHSPTEITRATTAEVIGRIASDPAALTALVHIRPRDREHVTRLLYLGGVSAQRSASHINGRTQWHRCKREEPRRPHTAPRRGRARASGGASRVR